MEATRDHLPLVLAAAQAAGPPDGNSQAWLQRVQDLAVELYLLARHLGERLERIDEAAVFTGTIVEVRIEASSTRAIIGFRPDKTTQDRELEEIRTERGDTPAGAAMIARVRAMVGHRAVFYKYNEKMESAGTAPRGSTVRILVHLVDLGPAPVAVPAGRPATEGAPPASAPAAEAGAADELVSVAQAKQELLASVGGSRRLAGTLWNGAKLPAEGTISRAQLNDLLARAERAARSASV